MRKLSLILFLLGSVSVWAQDWESYQYGELYEGYVITNEGQKLTGFIKYQNRTDMQEEVIFYKTKTSSKSKYEAEDLKEYKVADKLYHCFRYSGNSAYTKHALLVIDGKSCIMEYVWYERAPGYNTLLKREGESDEEFAARKYPSKTVYHKASDELGADESYFKDDFAKKLSDFLSDNKELAKKVKKGESGYSQLFELPKIIKEYNDACGK